MIDTEVQHHGTMASWMMFKLSRALISCRFTRGLLSIQLHSYEQCRQASCLEEGVRGSYRYSLPSTVRTVLVQRRIPVREAR